MRSPKSTPWIVGVLVSLVFSVAAWMYTASSRGRLSVFRYKRLKNFRESFSKLGIDAPCVKKCQHGRRRCNQRPRRRRASFQS
jgi:hypothetical protein